MNLLYLTLFGLFTFLCLLLGGKRFRVTALYALAIGGAVNANYFHAGNFPIDVFGLSFGIDSIIYNLFIFCIIVMFFQKGKKQAYILSASSIIAIMFAAFYQLIAEILSIGYTISVWNNFIDFTISSLSSIFVVVLVLEALSLLTNKTKIQNQYVLLTIGMVLASLVNTPVYYATQALVSQKPADMLSLISTSYLGKLITIPLSLLTLYLVNLYDQKTTKKEDA